MISYLYNIYEDNITTHLKDKKNQIYKTMET